MTDPAPLPALGICLEVRGSRFWAKNQDRRPGGEKADEALAGTLTAMEPL